MIARSLATALCTALPIILILRYFYSRDLHREPRAVLARTFMYGLLSIVPAVLIGLGLSAVRPGSASIALAALYEAFVIAAIPEEGLVLLVIRGYSARQPSFDEPMDGLVFGVTAALGFAALENAIYALNGGWTTALVRAFTAVPMHAACGAILGNAVAQSEFDPAKRGAIRKGFLAAVTVHGLYDFGLIAVMLLADQPAVPGGDNRGGTMLGLLALVGIVLIGAVIWTLRTMRRLRSQQLATDRVLRRTEESGASDGPSAPE